MRIKIISHKRMKESVNYLYNKLSDPNTFIHPLYNDSESSEMFMNKMNDIKERQSNKVSKDVDINNIIKHLVVTFHPDDKVNLKENYDKILKDVLEELNLDPNDHLVTAFVHNDRSHPHVHLTFSRVGVSENIFNDKKLGWKCNDIANKLDLKYNLTKRKRSSVKIHYKHLYNPTDRGELLKLINYATIESNSLTEFQKILKENGVVTRKGEDNTFTYITKNRAVFKENTLPKEARMNNLFTLIKTQKHTKEFVDFRNNINDVISQCKTLDDLKTFFPDSKIYYQKVNENLQNVSIEWNGMTLKLSETILGNIKNEDYIKFEDSQNFAIFVPYVKDTSYQEKMDERNRKRKGKRARQIGFKVQI
jgi:hypothetical protein